MPILYFPSCVLFSTTELIVPDMTVAQVAGDHSYISIVSSSLLNKCLIYAVAIAGLVYTFASSLSLALYGSAEPAPFLKVFALLLPIVYLNMMTDGLLRGLGQQTYVMIYNIIVAVLSTLAIKFFLPLHALTAYIVIFAVTECSMFAFGVIRLNKLTEIRMKPWQVIAPVVCAIGAFNCTDFLVRLTDLSLVYSLILSGVLGLALYAGLIYILYRALAFSPRPKQRISVMRAPRILR